MQTLETNQRQLSENITALTMEHTDNAKRNENLRVEIDRNDTSLKTLRSQLKELNDKGYTEEILFKLLKADSAGGDLLTRVETLQKFEDETSKMKENIKSLNIELNKATKSLNEITTRINSDQTKEKEVHANLLKIMDDERLYRNSINIVRSIIEKYSLTDQDFKNFLSLVEKIGIIRMPGQTIDNLKSLLDKYQTLERLETEILGRRDTLEKLKLETGKLEVKLESSSKEFTEATKKIQAATETTIKDVHDSILKLRDDAIQTGELIGRLVLFSHINDLLKGQGKQTDILLTIDTLCNTFRSWILKHPTLLNSTLLNRLNDFIESLEEIRLNE